MVALQLLALVMALASGHGRLAAMVVLAGLGMMLFFAAPWIARGVAGRRADPVPLAGIVRFAGVLLLLGAMLVRPYNPDTAVFPPPPEAPPPGAFGARR